ncbi:FixH family protein [Nostoc sp. KVJ3]|uniref:FixH family protein n=1 Tax=Nostoc sp. KVJ3 TaxID=457945 RepID=UPI0022386847|nr:FixH family protein [Nostoc sp. KVJ3]
MVCEKFRSKTKKPVQVEGLEVNVAMPMKNSSPMSTDVEVKPDTQLGRFQVNTYLSMSGKWEVTAKVKDKSRIGNSSFTLDNR